MRNHTASSHSPMTGTPVRNTARRGAAHPRKEGAATPFAISTQDKRIPAHGALPSYCERKPAAMLDDGWVGEPLDAADDPDTMDAYDDFLEDTRDIEDSR